MAQTELLQTYLLENLGGNLLSVEPDRQGMLTLEVDANHWLEVANFLRHDELTRFEQLIDLCGVDYLTYGQAEWDVGSAGSAGFSRAVRRDNDLFAFEAESAEKVSFSGQRFAVVVHLLSVSKNRRIRMRTRCQDNDYPVVPSLIGVWRSVDWYEREAFDLFGILFDNHPDLRRILTDYGFIGHPFRKDFPLIGHVEMRYDAQQQRVIYEPVSIEPRTLVPRVIRDGGPAAPIGEVDD